MEMRAQNSATRRPAFLLRQRARADSQGWPESSIGKGVSGTPFDKWTAPFDKWTTLLTNGPTFWQMTHVFFSRFYVWIFHVKINLDCGCLTGVGSFFWDHECLLGVEYFFFTVDRGCLLGVGFFWDHECLTGVEYFFWDHECLTGVEYFFLRSRMFVRCGVFFWDRGCLLGVGYFFFFWDHECLTGVEYFFEIVDVC